MGGEARNLHLHDLFGGVQIAFAGEEVLQREHLVHHDAEREEIDPPVDRFALQLLGREIGRLSFHRPCARRSRGAGEFGDPEVEQLHPAPRRHDHVGGGDVAMNHVEPRAVFVLQPVNAVERAADLAPDVRRDGGRHPPVGRAQGPQDARQRWPLDVLECQVQGPLVLAELERLHDVGMVDEAEDPSFVGEHADEVLVTAIGGQDPLDDHVALEAGRADGARLEHLGHAPCAERVQKLVMAEPLRPLDPPPRASQPRCLPEKSFQQHGRASDQLPHSLPAVPRITWRTSQVENISRVVPIDRHVRARTSCLLQRDGSPDRNGKPPGVTAS